MRHRFFIVSIGITILLADPYSPILSPPHVYAATVSPLAVDVTLPLGTTTSIQLEFQTTHAGSLRLFEANPPLNSRADAQRAEPTHVAISQQAVRIDPRLLAPRMSDDSEYDIFAILTDQADLSAAYQIADWDERGRFVYETLRQHAARSQAGLRTQLSAAGLAYTPFWIVNALLVQDASPSDVLALAARSDIALLRFNDSHQLPTPILDAPNLASCEPDADGICWPLHSLNVPRAWADFGIRGAGIVVASIDSGAVYTHSALIGQYRGNLGAAGFDHNYNWFDPDGDLLEPTDRNGHGTHTLGSLIGSGDGSRSQPIFGVAPEARWIMAQGCERTFCEDADLIAAAQWMLAPTNLRGTSPRPDLRPHLINNSWGDPLRQGDRWYRGITAAWRAAGIIPLFAAGNQGNAGCGSVSSPGEYPDVLTIGATDRQGNVAPFSSRGPGPNGLLKPDLVAPGNQIFSAYRSTAGEPTYSAVSGTSMAVPHVGGIVALLLSANPPLIGDYPTVYRILTTSARHSSAPSNAICGRNADGASNIAGYGIPDAYGALAALDIPWMRLSSATPTVDEGRAIVQLSLDARRVSQPGTYRARILAVEGTTTTTVLVTLTVTSIPNQQELNVQVRDRVTNLPLAATLAVRYPDSDGPYVRFGGDYQLQLPPNTYQLGVRAAGYLPMTRTVVLNDAPMQQVFELQADLPQIEWHVEQQAQQLTFGQQIPVTLTITNTGTQPLDIALRLPPDGYNVQRSDENPAMATTWEELPATAADIAALIQQNGTISVPIDLGFEFTLYNRSYREIYITENGTLSFIEPSVVTKPLRACLPTDELPFLLIVPFKADLDLRRGGQLRHGPSKDGMGYIISYENVPLSSGEQRYTFQAILRRDGSITFTYRNVEPLPERVDAGVQLMPTQFQSLVCGSQVRLRNGLSMRLQPQPAPDQWIMLPHVSEPLAPGNSITLTIQLNWVPPLGKTTFRGNLELSSNDPYRPTSNITLQLQPLIAPERNYFVLVNELPLRR